MAKSTKNREMLLSRGSRTREDRDYLSTGSTLVNLSLTGDPHRGFLRGGFYYIVGDSQSGKTFWTLTAMAEATINPVFDDYRLIFDDVEGGALMDFERYFGSKAASRIEPPGRDDQGEPLNSYYNEDLWFHVDDAYAAGKPFIYLLDSMDALSSHYEEKKFQERKTARRRGTDPKGDYGDGKAKLNSANIRQSLRKIRDTGSILLVISQTRDLIGALPFGPTKTRSGGRSLTFYATVEIWTSVKGRIRREIKGKKRTVGAEIAVHIRKNRTSGKDRTVLVPIYYSSGIDDLGSCINWMVQEGIWKGTDLNVQAPEFDHKGSKELLIRKIEQSNQEEKLRELVATNWREIEAACEVPRKNRYQQGSQNADSDQKRG